MARSHPVKSNLVLSMWWFLPLAASGTLTPTFSNNLTNQNPVRIHVNFGDAVQSFNRSQVSRGPDSVAFTTGVYPSSDANLYTMALNVSTDGNVTVVVGEVPILYINGTPVARQSLSFTVDRTAPNVTVVLPEGTSIQTEQFDVSLVFSEPVVNFTDNCITFITKSLGGGAFGSITQVSDVQYNFQVLGLESPTMHDPWIEGSSQPGTDLVTVVVGVAAKCVKDRAGNSGPLAARAATVTANLQSLRQVISPPGKANGMTPTSAGLIAAVVILVVIACVAVCCWKQWVSRSFQRTYTSPADIPLASRHQGGSVKVHVAKYDPVAESEFLAVANEIFDGYRGNEQADPDKVTFDQIVAHSLNHGFGQEQSEEGARKLIRAADMDKDGQLSRNDFIEWLRKVIVKGDHIRRRDVQELKRHFGNA